MTPRDPTFAAYDWRAFGNAVRSAALVDGRRDKDIAAEIGVTVTAFSKASSGANIAVGHVIAICDWMRSSPRDFYLKPEKSNACTLFRVEQGSVKHDVERTESAR